MRGCLRIIRNITLLFILSGASITVLYHYMFHGDLLEAVAAIKAAPVKNLQKAMSENGPAFVKVKLKPLSDESAATDWVWVRNEYHGVFIEEINKGGKWERHETRRQFAQFIDSIPVALYDESGSLEITDWLGIEISSELLETTEEPFDPKSSAFLIDPHALELSEDQLRSIDKLRRVVLKPGREMWIFGRFNEGRPAAYLNDRFHFTGLTRDEFTAAYEAKASQVRRKIGISLALAFTAMILLLISLFKGGARGELFTR